MLQNPCKTLGFKKNMVYKIPPGGEVNHIQPVAYRQGQRANRLVKPGIEPATPDYKASGNYLLVYHGDSYSKLLSAANLK